MTLCFSAPIELFRAASNLYQTVADKQFHVTHVQHVTAALRHLAASCARLQKNRLHLVLPCQVSRMLAV